MQIQIFQNYRTPISFNGNAAVKEPKQYQTAYQGYCQKIKNNRHAWRLPFSSFTENMYLIVNTYKQEGLTIPAYLKSIAKCPQIVCSKPTSIINNINTVTEHFKDNGLTKKDYIKSCLKQPAIMALDPQNVINNIEGVVKKYCEHGLSTEDYIKVALRQPSLFGQKPERVIHNVNAFVECFGKSGMDIASYIKAFKRNPTVLCLDPNNLINNTKDMVKEYSQYGLSEEKYVKILKLFPIGLTFNAQNKIKSIDKLINTFAPMGLTKAYCIRRFISQPSLFTNNMEKVTNNIRFFNFVEEEKYIDAGLAIPTPQEIVEASLNKNLSYSTETNYLLLLRNKLKAKYDAKIPLRQFKTRIPEYLKEHQGEVFQFDISKSEFTEDFIKFVDKYSKQVVGKNIFKIVVR